MPDTTLTSAELDELERLAKAATPGQEWFADMSGLNLVARPPGDCFIGSQTVLALCATGEHVYQVLPYVAAAQPATILRLLSLARAGLEAGKAEEWLPIETAPKDGTKLLLGRFTNGKAEIDHNGYMAVDHWRSPPQHDFTGWGKFNMQYWPVTHWRPLPAPPAIRSLPLTGGDKP